MRYEEWQAGVHNDIKGDSLWKLEVYRLGLFISDIAWQDALELNKNHLTRGIADQLYRAVCSISANIAEGYKKKGKADKARLMNIAQGSIGECQYYLILAKDPGHAENSLLINLLDEISKMLQSYITKILSSNS